VTNAYYNFSGNFLPGTLARAEAVSAEFSSVATGFSKLSIQGIDTGVANAYVVTTTGYPVAAYQDGNNVQFEATHTNTGPSTINVNGIGAVPLLRFNGNALVSGDVVAGAWYTCIYTTLYGGFVIVSPTAYATFAGTISLAPPTNKVGLVAAGGAATAAAPIDATWAIDQSIAPTWSGAHTFGTTGIQVGTPAGGNKGAGTINVSGGLYVNNVALTTSTGATPTQSVGLAAVAGSAGTFIRSDGAPALSQSIAPTWSAQHIFSQTQTTGGQTGDAAVMVKATAPSIAMVCTTGGTDAKTWNINVAPTTLALVTYNDTGSAVKTVIAATRSGNVVTSMQYANATDATGLDHQFFGSIRVGAVAAVGGNGNLNAAALYQAGQQMFITGTFTGTLTGMASATTGTMTYTISGNIATLYMGFINGTSNSTSFTITGLPAALQPATLSPFVPAMTLDNGGAILGGAALSPGSGTITMQRDVLATGLFSATGWTASGSKGTNGATITYSLQ
jgi:hypothetical protein